MRHFTIKQAAEYLGWSYQNVRNSDRLLEPEFGKRGVKMVKRVYRENVLEQVKRLGLRPLQMEPRSDGRTYTNESWRREQDKGAHGPGWVSAFSVHLKGCQTRNLVNGLTLDAFVALCLGECLYCGRPPEIRKVSCYKFARNGVDRVDNTKGYVDGNCTSCCTLCNRMKCNLGLTEFAEHIRRVATRFQLAGIFKI